REPGRLVRGAQVRAVPVRAPVLVDELAERQRVVAEVELRHVLRHRPVIRISGSAGQGGCGARTGNPTPLRADCRTSRATCRGAAGRRSSGASTTAAESKWHPPEDHAIRSTISTSGTRPGYSRATVT